MSIAGPSPIIHFFEHAHNAFTSTTPRVLHFSGIHWYCSLCHTCVLAYTAAVQVLKSGEVVQMMVSPQQLPSLPQQQQQQQQQQVNNSGCNTDTPLSLSLSLSLPFPPSPSPSPSLSLPPSPSLPLSPPLSLPLPLLLPPSPSLPLSACY